MTASSSTVFIYGLYFIWQLSAVHTVDRQQARRYSSGMLQNDSCKYPVYISVTLPIDLIWFDLTYWLRNTFLSHTLLVKEDY